MESFGVTQRTALGSLGVKLVDMPGVPNRRKKWGQREIVRQVLEAKVNDPFQSLGAQMSEAPNPHLGPLGLRLHTDFPSGSPRAPIPSTVQAGTTRFPRIALHTDAPSGCPRAPLPEPYRLAPPVSLGLLFIRTSHPEAHVLHSLSPTGANLYN
jgi:hypothetical protein